MLLEWLNNPIVLQYVYEKGAPWDLEKVQQEFAEKTIDGGSAVACLILRDDKEIGYLQYYPIDEDSYKYNDVATYEKIKEGCCTIAASPSMDFLMSVYPQAM